MVVLVVVVLLLLLLLLRGESGRMVRCSTLPCMALEDGDAAAAPPPLRRVSGFGEAGRLRFFAGLPGGDDNGKEEEEEVVVEDEEEEEEEEPPPLPLRSDDAATVEHTEADDASAVRAPPADGGKGTSLARYGAQSRARRVCSGSGAGAKLPP